MLRRLLPGVPPQSALGKALAYTTKQWPKLVRYLEPFAYLNLMFERFPAAETVKALDALLSWNARRWRQILSNG